MQLPRQLLIRVRLDAERFPYAQHFEQEGQLAAVSLGDSGGHEGLVVLDHIE